MKVLFLCPLYVVTKRLIIGIQRNLCVWDLYNAFQRPAIVDARSCGLSGPKNSQKVIDYKQLITFIVFPVARL